MRAKNLVLRLQLYHCSQVRRLWLIEDVVGLEKVQRRAIELILSDSSFDYKARLTKFDIYTTSPVPL